MTPVNDAPLDISDANRIATTASYRPDNFSNLTGTARSEHVLVTFRVDGEGVHSLERVDDTTEIRDDEETDLVNEGHYSFAFVTDDADFPDWIYFYLDAASGEMSMRPLAELSGQVASGISGIPDGTQMPQGRRASGEYKVKVKVTDPGVAANGGTPGSAVEFIKEFTFGIRDFDFDWEFANATRPADDGGAGDADNQPAVPAGRDVGGYQDRPKEVTIRADATDGSYVGTFRIFLSENYQFTSADSFTIESVDLLWGTVTARQVMDDDGNGTNEFDVFFSPKPNYDRLKAMSVINSERQTHRESFKLPVTIDSSEHEDPLTGNIEVIVRFEAVNDKPSIVFPEQIGDGVLAEVSENNGESDPASASGDWIFEDPDKKTFEATSEEDASSAGRCRHHRGLLDSSATADLRSNQDDADDGTPGTIEGAYGTLHLYEVKKVNGKWTGRWTYVADQAMTQHSGQ